MLQQTQVSRVVEKYHLFLKAFPTVNTLAQASLADVLVQWSGLGYNRRAKFLKAAAETVVIEHKGRFPKTVEGLLSLPGVGPYTARAVAAFAYNTPDAFIETNIRSVYIHHFFHDQVSICDVELLPIIAATLDTTKPREWYWALMDYGSFLKVSGNKVHRKSAHYAKQSKFDGSRRQVRGMLLKLLTQAPATAFVLSKAIEKNSALVIDVLVDLEREGFVMQKRKKYMIK